MTENPVMRLAGALGADPRVCYAMRVRMRRMWTRFRRARQYGNHSIVIRKSKKTSFFPKHGNLEADTKAAAAREAEGRPKNKMPDRNRKMVRSAKDRKPNGVARPQHASTTGLAPPERPLVPPLMPALTARFNFAVDTTSRISNPSRILPISTPARICNCRSRIG